MHFRHLLERHELGQELFEEIKGYLSQQGVMLKRGSIVDATIIDAPSSTRNKANERDPEMSQVKKGQQYYFGMKLHIGVDAESGLMHSMATTPANMHDVTQAHRLLHGEERAVWGDSGYIGVHKREENREIDVEWYVAMRAGARRKLEPGSVQAIAERVKSSIRAKVEHPFWGVKGMFGYAKVRYRGLAKNTERLAVLVGLYNLKRA